jgi:hypothetical protein
VFAPTANRLTYRELVKALAADGVTANETPITITMTEPKKVVLKITHLRRVVGKGRQLRRSIQAADMDEVVPPSEIRSICAQLELDPTRFGFRFPDEGRPYLAAVPDEE